MTPETPRSPTVSALRNPPDVACLVSHVAARLAGGSFVTVIHSGNSDYLRFLHDLVAGLLLEGHMVEVLDFRRAIKLVYIQHMVKRATTLVQEPMRRLNLHVILDEEHAIAEAQRLNRQNAPRKEVAVVVFVDPSTLLGRLVSRVKEAAAALRLQYEIAQALAAKGYAIVLADAGGRELHRAECLVPSQLAQSSTLLLQFLPHRVCIQ